MKWRKTWRVVSALGILVFGGIVTAMVVTEGKTLSGVEGEIYEVRREAPPFRAYGFDERLEVKSGDTFGGLLRARNISGKRVLKFGSALEEGGYDPRYLREGQHFWLRLSAAGELEGMRFFEDNRRSFVVMLEEEAEVEVLENRPLTRYFVVSGRVERGSLYKDLRSLGLSDKLVIMFIDIFGFDVDFQRDIHEGNRFLGVFGVSSIEGEEEEVVILKALLESGSGEHTYYGYEVEGRQVFYDSGGKSAKKALMRTPISGARLSSGFGFRKHPIKGFVRKHQGVDFAAPTGTPIYAAGSGVVEKKVYGKGYGRYMVLRHGNNYKTLYAHMSRFARGMRKGRKVRQGEVIGYVGSTGLSTGPHLHYEVIKGGVKVNPATLRLPKGKSIKRENLEGFVTFVNRLDEVSEGREGVVDLGELEGYDAYEGFFVLKDRLVQNLEG